MPKTKRTRERRDSSSAEPSSKRQACPDVTPAWSWEPGSVMASHGWSWEPKSVRAYIRGTRKEHNETSAPWRRSRDNNLVPRLAPQLPEEESDSEGESYLASEEEDDAGSVEEDNVGSGGEEEGSESSVESSVDTEEEEDVEVKEEVVEARETPQSEYVEVKEEYAEIKAEDDTSDDDARAPNSSSEDDSSDLDRYDYSDENVSLRHNDAAPIPSPGAPNEASSSEEECYTTSTEEEGGESLERGNIGSEEEEDLQVKQEAADIEAVGQAEDEGEAGFRIREEFTPFWEEEEDSYEVDEDDLESHYSDHLGQLFSLRHFLRRFGDDEWALRNLLEDCGPDCPECDQPAKLRIYGGRWRYVCRETWCDQKFIMWADDVGIESDNPQCYCERASRRDRDRCGFIFYDCVNRSCGFKRYLLEDGELDTRNSTKAFEEQIALEFTLNAQRKMHAASAWRRRDGQADRPPGRQAAPVALRAPTVIHSRPRPYNPSGWYNEAHGNPWP